MDNWIIGFGQLKRKENVLGGGGAAYRMERKARKLARTIQRSGSTDGPQLLQSFCFSPFNSHSRPWGTALYQPRLHPATARATAPLPGPPTSQPPPKHSPAAPLRVSRCLPRASVKPPREPLWEATQYPCPQVLRAPRRRGKEPARPTLLPRGLGGEPRSTCPLLPRPRE